MLTPYAQHFHNKAFGTFDLHEKKEWLDKL